MNRGGWKLAIITLGLVLTIDQIVKFWIKLTFSYGDEIHVIGNWFILHFIENYGMAFGMQLAGNYGKILLSLFRIIAIGAIGYYLYTLIKQNSHKLLIITISMILAGAIGNLIDSMFYGLIFSESSPGQVAELFPEGGGYATFLHGKVVDMFYFPIIDTTLPDWVPFWGGGRFTFFDPVFNIADSSISIGVCILIVFQKKIFKPTTQVETIETKQ